MRDLIGLLDFHLVALLVCVNDRPDPLGVGHKAVHKRLQSHLVRLLGAEIQNIKNGLDPICVKAFPIFQQAVDLLHHAVQRAETLPHLQHILPVLRGDFTGDGPAVEAQLHGGNILLGGGGEDRTDQGHDHNDGGKDGHQYPADLLPSSLVCQSKNGRFDRGSNADAHRRMSPVDGPMCSRKILSIKLNHSFLITHLHIEKNMLSYLHKLLTSLVVASVAFWYPLNSVSLMLAIASCVLNYLDCKEEQKMGKRMQMVSQGICGTERPEF